MHESTPRPDHETPTVRDKDPEMRASSRNSSSRLKKSHSLRAGSFYSRFDELIKNTCDMIVNPLEVNGFNLAPAKNQRFSSADDFNRSERRYIRSHYDKSLLAYADGLTHAFASAHNEPHDENKFHAESSQSNSNTDANTNITINFENSSCNRSDDTNMQTNTATLDLAGAEASNSSFFEVSKKVETPNGTSVDSTLEVDLDYCNESFIIWGIRRFVLLLFFQENILTGLKADLVSIQVITNRF